jgi:hypothetical protein
VAGAGVAVGAAAFCAVDVDPRPAPSERETVAARSLTVSLLGLVTKLVIGVALELAIGVALALVAATAVSEGGVAGAISMRAATSAASADIVTAMSELSSRVPFLGRGIEDRTLCDHVRAHRATIAVNGYGRRS